MESIITLKRCPFCGGEATFSTSNGVRPDGKMNKVQCEFRKTGCPVNMRTHYTKTPKEAADLWNSRVGELTEPESSVAKLLKSVGYETSIEKP